MKHIDYQRTATVFLAIMVVTMLAPPCHAQFIPYDIFTAGASIWTNGRGSPPKDPLVDLPQKSFALPKTAPSGRDWSGGGTIRATWARS